MVFIYLYQNNTIIATEDPLKGSEYEQLLTVKDLHNVEKVLARYDAKYKIDNRINKKKLLRFTAEQRALGVERMTEAVKGVPKSVSHRLAMSEAKKGKASNFKGKNHTDYAKALIKIGRGTRDPIMGKKWCHDPMTGKEKRCHQLPEGYRWGRTPEFNDWKTATSL